MKPWRSKIAAHVEAYSTRLGPSRAWWSKWLYHFTDVRNAIEILKAGSIYSREKANQLGLMKNDNAAQKIIANTAAAHQRFARLYFRPRTPTQYHNEGIRPASGKWDNAHCPVPVFFCFDTVALLSRDGVQFSNGNMARSATRFDDSEAFFDTLNFDNIFHNRPLVDDKDTIVNARHTEVLVPDELVLDSTLRYIFCRSAAELQTLVSGLSLLQRAKWSPRIKLGVNDLFDRRWAFVDSVSVENNDTVVFKFNPDAKYLSAEFDATFVAEGPQQKRVWSDPKWEFGQELRIRNRNPEPHAIASLTLDGCLAYRGRVFFADKPF